MKTSIQFMVSLFGLTVTVTEILDMTAGAEGRDSRIHLERGQEIEDDNNPPKISIPIPMTYPLSQGRNPDYTNTNQPLNYPGRAYYDHLGTGVRRPAQVGVTPLAREVRVSDGDADGRLFGEPGYLESRPRPEIKSRLREPSNEERIGIGIEQPRNIQQPIPYTNQNQRSPPPPLVSRNNQLDLPYSIPHVRPQSQQFPNSPLSDCECSNRDPERNIGPGYLRSPTHKDRNREFNSAHFRQEGGIQEVPPPFPYYLGWGREREYLRLHGRDFDRPEGPGPDRSDYYRGTVPLPQIYDRG